MPSSDSVRGDRVLTAPFVILWLAGFANYLASGAVNPLLPRFVKDTLGWDDVVVGVVVALLAVSAIAVRPFVGPLANRRGRRFVAIAGAGLTAVSFALYAVPSLAVLVPARLLTGAAQALFVTGTATMVTELAPDHRRAEAVSYFSISVYLGTGLGPAIGESVGTTWTIGVGFLAAAAVGTVATVTTLFVTETGDRTAPAADEPPVKGINRAALLPGCVMGLAMVATIAFGAFMPLYADELGMDRIATVYLLYSGVIIAVRVFGARLPDILGPRRCGTVATTVIALGMATIAGTGTSWGLYLGAATLAVGSSFLYPSLMTLVVDRTPAHERSSAVGTLTMFFDVAAGVGGLTMGLVASAAGYRSAFATAAFGALGGLALFRLVVLRAPDPGTHRVRA